MEQHKAQNFSRKNQYWTANATSSPTFQLYYRFDFTKNRLLTVESAAGRKNNAANGIANPTYSETNKTSTDGLRILLIGLLMSFEENKKWSRCNVIFIYKQYYSINVINNRSNQHDMDIDNSSADIEDSIACSTTRQRSNSLRMMILTKRVPTELT